MTDNPQVLVEAKPMQRSKTLIFNLVAFVAMALPLVQTWAGSTNLLLPPWTTEALALLIPLVNLLLRFATTNPVNNRVSATSVLVDGPEPGRF